MKDLVVRHKRNKAKFKFLKWDTKFFGIKSYMLDVPSLVFKRDRKEFVHIVSNSLSRSFATAKVPSFCSKHLTDFLSDIGFKYITTEILIKFDKSSILNDRVFHNGPSNVVIEKVRRIPRDACLLGREFSFTRFHLDNKIKKEKSHSVWTSYIRNYRLDNTHHLFIARIGTKTIGGIFVNQYVKNRKKVSNLFIVAVRKKYRGRNIGSLLLKFTVDWCNRCSDAVTVGTQSDNPKALNFYITNGFSKVVQKRTILHRWGKNEK